MNNFNEKNLDAIFDEKSINKTLKKAKRSTFTRSIITSTIVFIFLGFVFNEISFRMLTKKSENISRDEILQDALLRAPNTIIKYGGIDINFLSGRMDKQVYKIIENKIIHWDEETINFGFRGAKNSELLSSSTIIDETTYMRFPNGQKEMLFYVPKYTYKKYSNEMPNLNNYPNDKYIELALSFDKNYKFDEVNKMLPESVSKTWYWIDNYANRKVGEEIEPISGRWMYGISTIPSQLGKSLRSIDISDEESFLHILKKYNKKDYNSLKQRQKDGLIIGVVVTGTKEELLSLQNESYIKASSIGAVVDKY
ncbi:MAG: polymerase sigma factor, sigma-70 family [Bacillales bacterium]|jgi:hypothetical protein|nr:polymerase sigma factor, sigma-70 family [Bacillales bacterium]